MIEATPEPPPLSVAARVTVTTSLHHTPAIGPAAVVVGAVVSIGTGGASTVKARVLEAAPPVGVTVTFVAPAARLAGTVAVTEVALQAVVVAAVVAEAHHAAGCRGSSRRSRRWRRSERGSA